MNADDEFDKLFQFMKGKCDVKDHAESEAIYYCTFEKCRSRFLCSECIIENPNHFTSHLKSFIPLDAKQKFLSKSFNLSQFENTKEEETANLEKQAKVLKESLDSSSTKINKYYDDIKQSLISFVDEHREKHLQEYKNALDEQIRKNSTLVTDHSIFIKNLKPEAKLFVSQGDRNRFYKFYEKINQDCLTAETNFKNSTHFFEDLNNEIKPANLDGIKQRIYEYIEKNFKYVTTSNDMFKKLEDEHKSLNTNRVSVEEDRIKEKFIQLKLEEDKILEKEKEISEEKKKNTKTKLDELRQKVEQISKIQK